jgi:hypothetical protein
MHVAHCSSCKPKPLSGRWAVDKGIYEMQRYWFVQGLRIGNGGACTLVAAI